jgi:hypothetical protein
LGALVAALACEDDPLKSRMPEAPPPPSRGVQAFVQVSNTQARPGEEIRVSVRVQFGTDTDAKLGSYTGRLAFDPEVLSFKSETKINDGLRVTNPGGAGQGEIRFAGASASGFLDLTIFTGVFEVKKTGYTAVLKLTMEELSAALTLSDLTPGLNLPPQVFLRPTAN